MCRSRIAAPLCPGCSEPSSRLHSSYPRRLADLPWQGRRVQIEVRVRRLRTPHLRRAPARGFRAVCATDSAPGQPAAPYRPGAGRQGGRAPGRADRHARERCDLSSASSVVAHLSCPPRRRVCSGWTIGRGDEGSATARFSWTWNAVPSSICCPTVRRIALRPGCRPIPVWRSSPVIVVPAMLMVVAAARPVRFMSPTGGTCWRTAAPLSLTRSSGTCLQSGLRPSPSPAILQPQRWSQFPHRIRRRRHR